MNIEKDPYPIEKRRRPILTFPRAPELVVPFPPRSQDWEETFPALIKPWLDGLRAFWLPAEQMFQLESGDLIRVDGIEPQTPYEEPLEGVFWEKYKTPAQIRKMVLQNEPSAKLQFDILDIARGEDAVTRAELCQQIPSQQNRQVYIVQMYQVNTPGAFNQWLSTFKGSMFSGSLTAGYQDAWGSTVYEVDKPVRLHAGKK